MTGDEEVKRGMEKMTRDVNGGEEEGSMTSNEVRRRKRIKMQWRRKENGKQKEGWMIADEGGMRET